MNFFDDKDLGNHLLQLHPKVVKHPVYYKKNDKRTLQCQVNKLDLQCSSIGTLLSSCQVLLLFVFVILYLITFLLIAL